MLDATQATSALNALSKTNPVLYVCLLTFWAIVFYYMVRGVIKAMAPTRLTDIERVRLHAYEIQTKEKHVSPKE